MIDAHWDWPRTIPRRDPFVPSPKWHFRGRPKCLIGKNLKNKNYPNIGPPLSIVIYARLHSRVNPYEPNTNINQISKINLGLRVGIELLNRRIYATPRNSSSPSFSLSLSASSRHEEWSSNHVSSWAVTSRHNLRPQLFARWLLDQTARLETQNHYDPCAFGVGNSWFYGALGIVCAHLFVWVVRPRVVCVGATEFGKHIRGSGDY